MNSSYKPHLLLASILLNETFELLVAAANKTSIANVGKESFDDDAKTAIRRDDNCPEIGTETGIGGQGSATVGDDSDCRDVGPEEIDAFGLHVRPPKRF